MSPRWLLAAALLLDACGSGEARRTATPLGPDPFLFGIDLRAYAAYLEGAVEQWDCSDPGLRAAEWYRECAWVDGSREWQVAFVSWREDDQLLSARATVRDPEATSEER